MRKAFILYKDGRPASVNGFVAEAGFRARGYEVVGFDQAQDGLFATREDIVFGSVQATRKALERLGVALPANIDIPDSLAAFAGRKIWKTDLGEIRFQVGSCDPRRYVPVFIKPLLEHKKFTGHVIRKLTDLLRTEAYSADEPVLAQAVVRFSSEWRVFVYHDQVAGIAHYNEDPLVMPDPARIMAMVWAFRDDSPVAYGLDVGIVGAETLLVEVNDAFALGSYGLAAHTYTEMIEARWDEMVGL